MRSRMKTISKRVGAALGSIFFGTWAATIHAVDWIGRLLVGDSYDQLIGKLPAWQHWLFTTPPWVPSLLAIFMAGFLVWLCWPTREMAYGAALLGYESNGSTGATLPIGPNTHQNALDIDFRPDAQHEIVEVFEVGTIRRTLKLSVTNRGNGWLSNCELTIERTQPSIIDRVWKVENGFTLQSSERRFCALIYFDEKYPAGHSAAKVLLPQFAGLFRIILVSMLIARLIS